MTQFVKSSLDEGWEREEDEKGNLVYHNKLDNITTKIHPHINRLKSTLYYLRDQIDDSEKKEAEVQRRTNLELIEESKKALKEAELKAAQRGTMKTLRALKMKSKATFALLEGSGKPKKTKAELALPLMPASSKDDQKEENKNLLYLLNDPGFEAYPLPFPSSSL